MLSTQYTAVLNRTIKYPHLTSCDLMRWSAIMDIQNSHTAQHTRLHKLDKVGGSGRPRGGSNPPSCANRASRNSFRIQGTELVTRFAVLETALALGVRRLERACLLNPARIALEGFGSRYCTAYTHVSGSIPELPTRAISSIGRATSS